MSKTANEYYGWTNWETWNAYNWISSYESTYTYFTEMVEELNCDIFEMSAKEYLREKQEYSDADVEKINYQELYRSLKGGE